MPEPRRTCCDEDKGQPTKKVGLLTPLLPLLAHVPCGIVILAALLGLSGAWGTKVHEYMPYFFLGSITFIGYTLSRWKYMGAAMRAFVVVSAVGALALWYPSRAHIAPWLYNSTTNPPPHCDQCDKH